MPAPAEEAQKTRSTQHSRRSRATSMLSSHRENSQATDPSGLATHSKSSCVPCAYLAAKSTIGNKPSQPSTSTFTLWRVEYGKSTAGGTWSSVHAR